MQWRRNCSCLLPTFHGASWPSSPVPTSSPSPPWSPGTTPGTHIPAAEWDDGGQQDPPSCEYAQLAAKKSSQVYMRLCSTHLQAITISSTCRGGFQKWSVLCVSRVHNRGLYETHTVQYHVGARITGNDN